MAENLNLCLHGHFYQPPRENPWIEEIEPQESARPYHNWNARIHFECYLPNAKARVLDEKGQVVDIVNNFKKISFNFGPTLLAWLQAHYPDTYQDILAADRVSVAQHQGHGNAIAQVYNHMIMPLANRRDKITQVLWGLAEFKLRFQRDAESIWLSETACNEETMEVLVEAGVKYIILAPHQAECVKSLAGGDWIDVSAGQIDPKKPYRCFLKKDPEKFIDIFFYDGPIAKAVGFEELLSDAKHFMGRLRGAVKVSDEPQLISVATDGETFGHHKAFGDRVLAYLLNIEAPRHDFKIVNYGEFLAACPPQDEVRIKEGDNGEGTSWSCAHGVARWKENCGCRGGGPADWNQNWRGPLREALDWLRDETAVLYEKHASLFLKDPWKARNDYIQVILERSEKNIAGFFDHHASRGLSKEERVICLKLLEMQRHSMLMYTSCGWFFTELSGIETVQIIQYAARVVQLAHETSGTFLEEEFLTRLAKAKSNIPEFKDGRGIYEKMVMPHVVTLHQVASFYAIHSLVDRKADHHDHFNLYCFRVQILHQRRESFGDLVMNFGRLKVTSKITGESSDLVFVAVHMGLYDFRCSVRPFTTLLEQEELEKEFFSGQEPLHLVELMRVIDRTFGEKYFSLKDLPRKERMRIILDLTHDMLDKISEAHEHLFDENRRMSEIYRAINLPIPEEMRYAAEHTLRKRMEAAVKELANYGFNPKKAANLQRIIETAKSFDVEVKIREASDFLTREMEKRTESLLEKLLPEMIMECLNIFKIAKKIKVELDPGRSQEHLFNLVKRWSADPSSLPPGVQHFAPSIVQLLTDLQINPEEFKQTVHSFANK